MNYYTNKELKKIKFCKLGRNVMISRKASIVNPESLSIGDYSRIDDFCILSGNIKIGRNVHITPMCLVGGGLKGVEISDFCTIAYNVKIFSQSDDYINGSITNSTFPRQFKKEKFAKVFLGKHVIIGASSIIMPGCKLQEGSAIGAMSLVNKNTKAWNVYYGIPAKLMRKRKKVPRDLLQKAIKSLK
jgi:acetyltransferase-like isoleucine patch superfamily enzyme